MNFNRIELKYQGINHNKIIGIKTADRKRKKIIHNDHPQIFSNKSTNERK